MKVSTNLVLFVPVFLFLAAGIACAEVYEQDTTDCTWVGYWASNPFAQTNPGYDDSLLEAQGGLTSNARSQRVLVRWDLSSITDALSVERATLTMHVMQSNHQAGAKVGVYSVSSGNNWVTTEAVYSRLSGPDDPNSPKWQHTGTVGASADGDDTYTGHWMWGNGTGAPVDQKDIVAPGSNYYLSWDVTAIVRDWLINGVENNGFALGMSQHVSSSTDYCHFSNPNAGAPLDRYPVLNIVYTTVPSGTYEAKSGDSTWVGYTAGDPSGVVATTEHYNDNVLEAQGGVNSESRSQRVLIRWDMSALTGKAANVDSATLTMHVEDASRQDPNGTIAVYTVSADNDWTETEATYQQLNSVGDPWQGTGLSGASGGGNPTYPGNWLNGPADAEQVTIGTDYDQSFDVTSIVQDWLVNGVQNNGFAVGFSQYTSSSTDYVYFTNPNRNHPTTWPSLQITYTLAAAPTNCNEAILQGYGKVSDLNTDCYTNLLDYAVLAEQWPDPMDLAALVVMAGEWLDCIKPGDINCEQPWP